METDTHETVAFINTEMTHDYLRCLASVDCISETDYGGIINQIDKGLRFDPTTVGTFLTYMPNEDLITIKKN